MPPQATRLKLKLLPGFRSFVESTNIYQPSVMVVFCSTSLPLASLDGFNQHFQAYVQFPLTSILDKSQQHQNKFSGRPRIKPGAA